MSEENDAPQKTIFFITGEPSGDVLAAGVMRSLKSRGNVQCIGIGGPLMEAEGLESLMPMEELCVMGLVEVLWQLGRILRLIHGVVEEIEKAQPDVLVTVDLPDFNFEVVKRLRKRGKFKGKIVHYVAPTVWAWRKKRAQKIAPLYDGLMCLFPFEPDYFRPYGLDAIYVGHPLIERDHNIDGNSFRDAIGIPQNVPVLGLFFGSRENEIKVHANILKDAALFLKDQYPNLHVMVPTPPALEYNVQRVMEDADIPTFIIADAEKKWDAMATCDVAVAVSGTVGLELSYMNVPHVIAYKMNPLSWLMVRLLVKVKYAHLTNIILDRDVVPEFLQMQCSPLKISREIMRIIKDSDVSQQQKSAFKELREVLKSDIEDEPSKRAADFVLQQVFSSI